MKAAKYASSIREERQQWASEFVHCMCCGLSRNRVNLEVHEIERRGQAPNRWGHTCNYLLLCSDCHSKTFASMPHAMQLAVKLVRDPGHYDLSAWLQIGDAEGRAKNRVMQWEVDAYARLLRYAA